MQMADYLQAVKGRFDYGAQIKHETADTLIVYDEIFKWSWIASKLKMTSFVQYVPHIDAGEIDRYSAYCLEQALKNHRGLPRGLQNGAVSYNVLVSESVSPDAIAFARSRPRKHYSAFEYPVICDLQNHALHYYTDKIIWGALYDSYMKTYIQSHFGI